MSVAMPRPLVRGARGAIACGHPLALSAGLNIFASGGNAVDAAVAAACCLAVLLPDACGLGGDALLLVRQADAIVAYNGSGAAPIALAGPVPVDGAAAAAAPGAVAAWETVQYRHGALPFADVLAPAEQLARRGFPIGESLLDAIAAQRRRLDNGASSWPLLELSNPGQLVRQPQLATLIGRIRREGAAAFYEGETAAAIERRVRADGGILSQEDLARHETVERPPLHFVYEHLSLALQPPVSQAVLTAMVLRELERAGKGREDERVHRAIESVEAAFAYRDAIGQPGAEAELLNVDLDVDPVRARRRGGPRGYAHTTAVTAADADGTIVSMLISVFDDFGSAALVPEYGFLLNDRMTGFSTDPASPNAAAPGRRPVHTLAPVIVQEADRVFAFATPGADGQVQTLAQLIDLIAVERAALDDGLARPRWRSQEGTVLLEAGFDPDLAAKLANRGHQLDWRAAGDSAFGAAAVAGIDLEQGTVFAAADPRRETVAGAL